ncbi:MAG TPA: OmpA family protein [Burkholderiaceae bacterium]|nr:OmpA family protein [Burkholderiaceae bacterium]
MSGGPDDAGAGGAGVLQDDWIEILIGFHPRTLTKAPAPGAPAKSGPGAPTAKADTCDTPQASGTTLFFDHDSIELTDSDKMLLDGYAKAYLRLGSTAKIKVDGYASDEGVKGRNDTLAQGRADQVKRHLTRAKITSGAIQAVGHGSTKNFGSDLCQNRRVMLAPPLDVKVADLVDVTKIEPVPAPPGSTSLGEPAKVPPVPDPPVSPETVSRAEAEAELARWLARLRKSRASSGT